jgi:hypothetical protein
MLELGVSAAAVVGIALSLVLTRRFGGMTGAGRSDDLVRP